MEQETWQRAYVSWKNDIVDWVDLHLFAEWGRLNYGDAARRGYSVVKWMLDDRFPERMYDAQRAVVFGKIVWEQRRNIDVLEVAQAEAIGRSGDIEEAYFVLGECIRWMEEE